MKLENLELANRLMKERQAYLHAASLICVGSQITLGKANTKNSPGGYQLPMTFETESEATIVGAMLERRAADLEVRLMELGVEV